MAESEMHINLVRLMFAWTSEHLLNNDHGSVFIDLPETKTFAKPPPIIDQYRPDLYSLKNNVLIIGEAKTTNDLDSIHSKNQFISYFRTCEMHEGNSILILAVPCFTEATAANLLKQIRKKNGFCKARIKVISQLIK